MIVIPAIDLKEGRCVRLEKGAEGSEKVYSLDAAAAAAKWKKQGAELLHVVDLDGAFSGERKNLQALREIVSIGVPVQFGGGVRNLRDAEEIFALGVGRVVLGTVFFSNYAESKKILEKFPGKVLVSVDCIGGMAAIKGWVEKTRSRAQGAAKLAEKAGAIGVVATDVSKDGMMQGPNLGLVESIARCVKIPVIASGGVSKIEDLVELKKTGCFGAIVGKALYEEKFSLKNAIHAVK